LIFFFGGYVKMAGEHPEDASVIDPRSLLAKPRWQRAIIAFAGPAVNIVLAVALLTGLFMVRFQKSPALEGPVTIGHVVPDSPAAKAGLMEGDHIVRIDQRQDPTWEEAVLTEVASANKSIFLVVERNGRQILTNMTPILDKRTGVGFAGWHEQNEIVIASTLPGLEAEKAGLKKGDVIVAANGQPIRSLFKLHEVIGKSEGKQVEILYSRQGIRDKVTITPTFQKAENGQNRWMIGVQLEPRYITVKLPFFEALSESVEQNVRSAGLIYQLLRGIVEQRMSARSLEGPIRIAQFAGEAAREGATTYIGFMAMVSLNLAVFNLLPIPILDGGVILMLLIEMIMRRDLSLSLKDAVFKVGFVFLMALVVFVLYNDISKILPSG
jgi:regulator of sigma E protease